MRSMIVCGVLLAAVLAAVGGMVVAQGAGGTVEGQVLLVQENTLFIRNQAGEPFAFNPMFVQEGNRMAPSRPARTILPALESGEVVSVVWFMDEREEVRRIREIHVVSALEGTTKARVFAVSPGQLVIRPKDEPGTVTLNTRFVQREGKSIPDPAISERMAGLQKGAKVTVRWQWDNEGRKRILGLEPKW